MEGNPCESCNRPMHSEKNHGGGVAGNPYCDFCTDGDGNLNSFEEIRKGMVDFAVSRDDIGTREAQEVANQHLRKMPAWRHLYEAE